MAITRVGGNWATSASTSSLSVTHGLTINADDVIVACIHTNNTAANSITDNNGSFPFTQAFQEANPTVDGTGQYAFFYRVAGGSEPSSYTFDSAATDRMSITLSVFDGVDTSTIWDVTPSSSTRGQGETGTTCTTAAMTTGTNGSWGIAAYLGDGSRTFSGYTNSYTNEVEHSPTADQNIAHVSREFATAGSQGTTAATISSSASWVAHQFSIVPAATNPVITDVDTDEAWTDGDTGLVITGTGFV